MSKEYRVWRKPRNKNMDVRGTQGHYVTANSPKEAIQAVRKKGERATQFDAVLWKRDRKMTARAKRLRDTGKW